MNAKTVEQIEEVLNYHFKKPELIKEAFTHSSTADDRLESNERMEFLGDAVLGVVICKALFDQFPDYLEGDLTKIKSLLVSRKICARIANNLKLTQFLRVGKGMGTSRAMTGSIAAGLLESAIAAIYLDGGMNSARRFILKQFRERIKKADAEQHQENFKSILQQFCQRKHSSTPNYELLDEKGPDHNKCFEICAVIQHFRYPSAWGITKKDAEQMAAKKALIELGLLEDDWQEE